VCNEFRDLDVFRAEAEQGLTFGFDGKTLIHPAQIDPCNAVFSPAPEELDWAEKVIAAFAAPEAKSKGAIQVEGRMAELLHLEQAQRLVELARRIAARADYSREAPLACGMAPCAENRCGPARGRWAAPPRR
jgi:citrate lyase subunit beta/citryl-CoA lyase